MWEFQQKRLCMKIWHHVLTLPITVLSIGSLHCAIVLASNSYYAVVASIFFADSSKAICGVALVRASECCQPFWLK